MGWIRGSGLAVLRRHEYRQHSDQDGEGSLQLLWPVVLAQEGVDVRDALLSSASPSLARTERRLQEADSSANHGNEGSISMDELCRDVPNEFKENMIPCHRLDSSEVLGVFVAA